MLLAAGLSLPRVAFADEASQARAHYETAQHLYDEGLYEEAIAEFELAYRDKPHPNVLYNIGQAHERLLDYRAAVDGFEHYLRDAAPDDPRRKVVENRLRVLRNLPARVTVSAIPEQVDVVLHASDGTVVSGVAPHVFSIPAGEYQLELTRDGWETERATIHVEIGQPYFYQYRLVRSMSDTVVESDPSGARVFIDERLVGETPWHGSLDVGRHGLLLEYPEYPWHREYLVVEPGKPGRRVVKMERPVRSGRTELVLGAMAFGGVVGPLLVGALSGSTHFTQTRAGLPVLQLSSAAGIAAGFAGAFFTTRGGISVSKSSILIGGGAFGTAMGFSLALGLNPRDKYIYGITLAGSAVGVATAALISHYLNVSTGDAAMVNSGGIWGTATGAMLVQAVGLGSGSGSDTKQYVSNNGWFLLGGTMLGITAGILAAKYLERTRTEVAIVDLGGLVGTGLGFALGYAIGVNDDSTRIVQRGSRFGLGGMAIGLVSGIFISKNFAKRLFRPKQPGRASLDLPQLRVEQLPPQEGGGTRVSLDVLRGTW